MFYAGTLLFYSCRSSPRHSECLQKKRDLRDQLESKIDSGLDRTLTAITGYVKFLLAAEQKKTDFKPDDDSAMLAMVSPVSSLKYSKQGYSRHTYYKIVLSEKSVSFPRPQNCNACIS